MKHLQLELTALSPLAIRSDHAPGGAATAQIIPGSSLAGCLASAHRLLYSERTQDFEALFLQGQVHYPYLYPANFNDADIQKAKLPVYPVPMTAQTCKKWQGFLFPKDEKEHKHGVKDRLLDWAIFSLLLAHSHEHKDTTCEIAALAILHQHHECKNCSSLMAAFKGYYRSSADIHVKAELKTRLQTRTGISRE